MKSLKRLFVASVLTLNVGSMYASEQPSQIQFVRPLGMGSAFTAVADDHNVFNYNPAGMVQRTGSTFTLLEVAVGGSTDLKDAAEFISDNEEDLTNFEDLSSERQQELIDEIANDISKLNPRIYSAGNVASFVSGPKFLGLPVHVGLGGFYVVDANFRIDNGVSIPNVSYEINNDIVLPVSVAHRWDAPLIPGKIGVGITGKLMQRSQVSQERLSIMELDSLDAPPYQKGIGIGSDIGLLYQPTERTNIGVMVKDFLGTKLSYDAVAAEDGFEALPEKSSVIRPSTNLGLALVPKKLLWLVPTSDRWTFSADVWDIFNDEDHVFFEDGMEKPFGEHLYTHLHAGAEFRWSLLRFRGGINEGYPTFGLGLDIPLLKIDYAFYSRELGRVAGDIKEENHVVSLALRFGSGSTESRERIQKAKEGKKVKEDVVPEAEIAAPSTPEPVAAPTAPAQPEAPTVPAQ